VVIALAAETGWEERFIFEELPLARFLIYRHVLLRRAGVWTVPLGAGVDEQLSLLGL